MKTLLFLKLSSVLLALFTIVSLVEIATCSASAASTTVLCKDLRIAIEAPTANAGRASLVVLVGNAGNTCSIKGVPAVTMWNSSGKVVAESSKKADRSTAPTRLVLAHNSVSSFEVSWSDESIGSSVRHTAGFLTVALPKGLIAQDTEFTVSEVIFGSELGVSPMRLGVSPSPP